MREPLVHWSAAYQTWKAWLTAASHHREIELSTVATDDEREERRRMAESALQGMVEPPVLDALRANRHLIEILLGQRTDAVFNARERGMTWEQIGEALGVTGQSALAQYREAIEQDGLGIPGLDDPGRRRAVLFEE